jgi:hypothetical protein
LLALIKLCVLNPDKRPHILPDQFVKERAWPTAPFGATCCLKRGAYSTATRFSVNRFFRLFSLPWRRKQRAVSADEVAYFTAIRIAVNASISLFLLC